MICLACTKVKKPAAGRLRFNEGYLMDILQDNTRAVLLSIGDNCDVPDYVMKSDVVEKSASYDFRDTLFADDIHRRFPLDSKASTWLSAAYFAKTAELDYDDKSTRDYVWGNIKRAADIYGISDDVEKVYSDIASPKQEKSAADVESNWGDFGLRIYPMFDAEGVKQASDYFERNCYRLLPATRHKVAKNIVRKAAEYSVPYGEKVRMEAELGIPDRSFLVENMLDRVRRFDDPVKQAAVAKLTEGVLEASTEEISENIEKIAHTIEDFDRELGLDLKYNREVLPPSHFCFDISVKEAEDQINDSVEIDGHVFSVSKLAELPEEVYTNALGDDFGSRIKTAEKIDRSKLKDEIYSLPLPDKKALVRSIREYAC